MNGVMSPPVRWSGRRWVTTIALLLSAQLMLLFYFGERSHMLPRALRSHTTLYLAADPLSLKQLAELPVADPALLALPSTNGFSGEAWLAFRPVEFTSAKWVAPPSFLALDVDELALPATSPDPEFAPRFNGFRTLPQLIDQVSVPPLPISSTSTLRLEDGLRGRRLLTIPELPSWRNDDLLNNTVVQVLVDKFGHTITARLIGPSSGLKAADDFALSTAASIAFEAAPQQTPETGTFGRLVFQWQTLPAGTTNSISSTR